MGKIQFYKRKCCSVRCTQENQFEPNLFRVEKDKTFVFIENKNVEFVIDTKNLNKVIALRWIYDSTGYPFNGKKRIRLHTFLLGKNKGKEIDHINGNKLDNRECNLRFCTHRENLRNQVVQKNTFSGFKGVAPNKKKWSAKITINGEKVLLGTFPTKEEAAQVYNEAAKKYYGKFAYLNKV